MKGRKERDETLYLCSVSMFLHLSLLDEDRSLHLKTKDLKGLS